MGRPPSFMASNSLPLIAKRRKTVYTKTIHKDEMGDTLWRAATMF